MGLPGKYLENELKYTLTPPCTASAICGRPMHAAVIVVIKAGKGTTIGEGAVLSLFAGSARHDLFRATGVISAV